MKTIFLLLLFPVFAQARQLSDLRSDARIYSRDGAETGRPRFTNADINALINEAQRDVIGYTKCVFSATQFQLVAGTTYYSLPSDSISIKRVTRDNFKLLERSPENLDKLNEWEEVSGLPTEYFINFSSRTKIGMYPFPGSTTDTGTVKVELYSQATDLSADADQPFENISEFYPFHQMLAYYAAYRMVEVDGNLGLADRYQARYLRDRETFKDYCVDRPSYRPSASPGK